MYNALTAAQEAKKLLDAGLDTGPLRSLISGAQSVAGETTNYSD